ncbi:hypothetical protein DFH27DRAFT_630844 [Peziza echinospora]|nr:hypothetical protein DFH27DRAFT_630844 [Peziza echinospora]
MSTITHFSRAFSSSAQPARQFLQITASKPTVARPLYRPWPGFPIETRSLLIRPSWKYPITQRRFQSQLGGSGTGSVGGASEYQIGPTNGLFGAPLSPFPKTSNRGELVIELQPGPSTQHNNPKDKKDDSDKNEKQKKENKESWTGTLFKMFEAAATTAASIAILGLAGYAYHKYYKALVLSKIDGAFKVGDPVLVLAAAGHNVPPADMEDINWVLRDEQEHINHIIAGETRGQYYLLIGEKGTGKSSMLLDAMGKVEGKRCSMLEAHADAEIFRSRLGKAIDFEYHEDYIGSLFSIRGPRETSPILDVERALNKLEKVALRRMQTQIKEKQETRDPDHVVKPLILIINSMHLLRDDDEGRDMLELLQQRAEAWAAQGLITIVFNSDDYWVFERLKQYSSRMEVISIGDLPKEKALAAFKQHRSRYYPNEERVADSMAERIYELVGGRLSFLNKVAKCKDETRMLAKCREIIDMEKTWLQNQCGLLGMEMDDDVMNQQKYASSAMVLVKALVEKEKQDKEEREAIERQGPEERKEEEKIWKEKSANGHQLPEFPLHVARKIMTRAEFIQQYDHMNIFTIDSKCMVRADSVPMQNAFREVAEEPGFNQLLEDTLQRIADIESLGRTREITIKDLWNGGKYNFAVKDRKGNLEKVVSWEVEEGAKDEDDD